jgi:hypothetical protein
MDGKSDTLAYLTSLAGAHNDPRNASDAAGAPGRDESSDQGNASDFSAGESGQHRERA